MLIIKESQINGMGVFSDELIRSGKKVGVWVSKYPIGDQLFQDGSPIGLYESRVLGRHANHSSTPNTIAQMENGEIFLYSKGIEPGEEITADYSQLENLINYKANIEY